MNKENEPISKGSNGSNRIFRVVILNRKKQLNNNETSKSSSSEHFLFHFGMYLDENARHSALF